MKHIEYDNSQYICTYAIFHIKKIDQKTNNCIICLMFLTRRYKKKVPIKNILSKRENV